MDCLTKSEDVGTFKRLQVSSQLANLETCKPSND
jgi:hypothetical protein